MEGVRVESQFLNPLLSRSSPLPPIAPGPVGPSGSLLTPFGLGSPQAPSTETISYVDHGSQDVARVGVACRFPDGPRKRYLLEDDALSSLWVLICSCCISIPSLG